MSFDSLIADEFPLEPGLIYMNHAGVGVWPRRTARAVRDFADENVRSGASHYPVWAQREQGLRAALQRFINAPFADDIALVASTSAALSIVACGLDWRWGDNVVGAMEEFPSNRMPWQAQRKWGVIWRGVALGAAADPEGALLAASLSLLEELGAASVAARVLGNTARLIEGLRQIRGSHVLTPVTEARRAGIVTVRLSGQDPEQVRQSLGRAGVVCAHRAGGVRFSPHCHNTPAQIDNLLEILRVTI